ncbi:MAG TPA: hypothetical protein V6C72_15090 [Chroococcales cyanobacterium]
MLNSKNNQTPRSSHAAASPHASRSGAPARFQVSLHTAKSAPENRVAIAFIECATAFLPVLAIEEGFDLNENVPVGIRTRVVRLSDFAANLGLDGNRPIGEQLAATGQISYSDARLIDGKLFDGLRRVRLRIDATAENIAQLLAKLAQEQLIDDTLRYSEQDGYVFTEVTTQRFIDLCNSLARRTPDLAVLLSVDDSILYL